MEGFQSPPIGSAILVAVLLVLGNLIVILMITMCANGTITRGGLAGIRTGATRMSDAAWSVGHIAARPVAQVGNGLGAVIGAASLFASNTVVPYLVMLGIAVVVTLGSVLVASIVAHRAATRELDDAR